MKSKTSRRLCQGMTLIEVLVAFVILGMVMAVIMRINATALRNHDVSKGYLAALQVAESRLESAGLENDSPTLIQRGTEANNIRWEFSRRLYLDWSEQRLQGLPATPVEERISVTWDEETVPRQLSLSRVNLIYRGR